MKNSLLSTTSGYLDTFTSKTMHSCSSWLNSLKAGHSFWLVLFLVSLAGISSPGLVFGQSADLDQIRNGGATSPINPPNWVNGNANATQAQFLEGHSIAYRMIVDDLGTDATVEHTLVIAYDHKKGTKNAIDFITHYQNLDPHHTSNGGPFNHFAENIKVLKGLNGAANAHLDNDSVTVDILAPTTLNASALATFTALPLAKRQMIMYGGGAGRAIDAFTAASYSYAGEETQLVIKFHSSNEKVVFAWGGHIATSTNWGPGNSAVFIPGSPYHTRLISIDGKGGNQDRALAAKAVVPLNPPTCLVVGDTITCAGADNMGFRAITDQPSISSYSWSIVNSGGANATLVGATNLDTVAVDPGTNGGSFSVQITITKVGAPSPTICDLEVVVENPDAVASVEDTLTCSTTEVQLSGSGGSSFSWTGPNNFISLLQNPMVSEPGWYYLTVQSSSGLCSSIDSVEVIENITNITVALGADQTLNCTDDEAEICPSVLPAGINYDFSWTGPNGFTDTDSCITVGAGGAGEYILIVTNPLNGCKGTDTIQVIEDFTSITVALGADQTISCTDDEAEICPSVLPAGINYDFSWTGPNFASTDSCITVGAGGGGEYILIVTNPLNGCKGTDTIQVIEDFTSITVALGADQTISCTDDEAEICPSVLPAGINYDFSWTGPNFASTDSCITVGAGGGGEYILIVTNPLNGCKGTDTIQVIEDFTSITVALGPDQTISCTDDEAEICPSVLPAGINYDFSWTGPNFASTDSCITVGAGGGGEYILIVTNPLNGCKGTDTIQVIEDFTSITVALGPDQTISCTDDEAEICPSVLPAGINYDFSWTGPNFASTDSCITVGAGGGGEYILIVTNPLNGCKGTDTIQVIEDFTSITVALGPDQTISCTDDEAEICPSVLPAGINYDFSWTGPNFASTDSCITVGAGGGGEYILIVTNPLNGCKGTDTIQVIEDFTSITVALGADQTISCTDDEAEICPSVLPAGINYDFSWTGPNFASTDSCITVGAGGGGEYILIVTNPLNGCKGTDTIQVIEDFTSITVALGPDQTISCTDDEAEICPSVLPAGINYDFSWTGPNFASTDSCITVGAGGGGEYILIVTNPLNGCKGTDTIQVIEDFTSITVALGPDQTISCTDDEAEICPSVLPAGINYDFSWTGPNGFTDTDSCITVGAGGGGEYILIVTNPLNGCKGTDTIQVIEDFDKPNINIGGPYSIACGQTSIQLNGASTDGVSFVWKVIAGTVQLSSSTILDPTATVSSVSATVRFIVTGANGCIDSADVSITKQICVSDKHCTLTQGAYGNANGRFCGGPRRLELINNLLAQGDLIIGVNTGLNPRSIKYSAGAGQCIIDKLPAGGTAAALPSGFGNKDGCVYSSLSAVLAKNGRFNNVLIGQVIALSLNTRLDNTLGSVVLTSTMTTYKASDCGPNATPILTDVITRTIPQSVLTYLGANATVANLLALANNALGGVYVPSAGNPSISDINAAVSAINEVFDECRILASASQLAINNPGARTEGPGGISVTSDKFVKAYPNPFTDKATIEFMTEEDLRYSLEMYDINGRLVSRLGEGTTQAGKAYNFEISAGNLPEGVYLVRFITDRYIETLKVIYKK